jgi:HAE1 family hydrophobic/amphiphilic exporter-1
VGEQQLNATITARSKLQTVEEFRADRGGQVQQRRCRRAPGTWRASSWAAKTYTITSRLNGKPGAAMGVVLADSANAMSVADCGQGQARRDAAVLSLKCSLNP